ncbi:motile sperm domain-containing protein 1-like [Diachasmimorpha longicaudata]|uniref:motile sperm domain-containing protein 1-like n=1 Tax=Diachasmimorpha longicaudata TaxID=58733 RepID=UPI0030B919EA
MEMHHQRTPQKFPVFVFPPNITFYLDDQSTHKQVLTLYNPYEFPVKFKVLSTAPNKYKVGDPEGTIKPKNCIDIVVRHTALLTANCNVVDKFRIQMQEHPTKQVIGKRDVEARLLAGINDTTGRGTPDPESFQQIPGTGDRQQRSYTLSSQTRGFDRGTNYVALIAGIICIIGLLLPTEGDGSHLLPEYFHLSVNFKLIFSFVLGMVTIIVLRL